MFLSPYLSRAFMNWMENPIWVNSAREHHTYWIKDYHYEANVTVTITEINDDITDAPNKHPFIDKNGCQNILYFGQ